jgi:hypothetical protein
VILDVVFSLYTTAVNFLGMPEAVSKRGEVNRKQ